MTVIHPFSFESNGGLAVNVQDQTTEVIDVKLNQKLSDLTLTASTSVDDTSVTGDVDAAFTPVVGNTVCLKEHSAFYQAQILAATNNGGDNWTLDLDTPLDFAFTTAGGCNIGTTKMNVDGSVTPQRFKVTPDLLTVGLKWDIVRFMLNITDASAMDDGKFGGITGGLTKGIVFRVTNGTRKNIFNAKTNGDLAARMYDVDYVDDTQGPAGLYGLRARRTFGGQSKNGVTVRLESRETDSDMFEIIIQDDLTDLDSFEVVVQGHVVE